MKHRPTIKDVAKEAGVSKSTVSLVLQDSSLVKEGTRQRVRAAMSKIEYVYNRSAANLRSSTTGLIGVMINDLRNPFFTEFAASLQMTLSEQGYVAVLANTNEDSKTQLKMVNALIEHGVSAFIVSPAYDNNGKAFKAIASAGLPAIQVFRSMEGISGKMFPFMAPDYEQGSRLATQHLLDQGAKRIAFVGGLDDRLVTRERISGYIDLAKQAGSDPLVLTGTASRTFGHKIAHVLKADYPDVDGVLCFNDQVALGILSGCVEIGRKVGAKFRVVGIDDIEDCQHSFPPLSSICCNIPKFAENVAERLLRWLNNGDVPVATWRTPIDHLVVRESSGP